MLPKAYDPRATEERIYRMWEEGNAFHADAMSEREAFSICMPPPNATGQLHLGHAVMLALQDIFIRFARMQGKEALWIPGTDHAAIATESLVIRTLQKEGMKDPRATLGREKLVEAIAAFVDKSRSSIRGQVRKMGCSCDWSRERYTMEPALHRVVNEVFTRMYHDGLIYRGHRIVNWDPRLQTTVSDDEVNYKEEHSTLYTFQYGPFQIVTARPETKFGDKYVVMHPDDDRYRAYAHGDTFIAEWINGPVRATVIKDAAIDQSFGTGVMTITPWHDAEDFEIASRHGLEKEQVIDYDGTLLPIAGEFAGMNIQRARPLIVDKLKAKGLLVKADDQYVHNTAVNSRGGATIEPQIKLQWFIDVNKESIRWKGSVMSLKQILHDVVHHGDVTIIPERFLKTYFHWIDNLRDWCISRQIWWGHRVPVWYRGEEVYAGIVAPDGEGWEQDTDSLDTWFSSALWTWSTLLDPTLAADTEIDFHTLFTRSPDFNKFHPTAVLETGYDILFFWVARMILMTTYTLSSLHLEAKEHDLVPFRTVYLHGLIRTRDGRKMSKSDPDTIIDPVQMIDTYGADALRLSMIVGQSPGNDSRLYEEKIAGYRNFINKLWNASRFVLLSCEKASCDPRLVDGLPQVRELSLADRALLHQLEVLTRDISDSLSAYRISEAGERLYSFVWDFFCDWYLELSKGSANCAVLLHALRRILHLLHPYCPFVTEEIWSSIALKNAGHLIRSAWPAVNPQLLDSRANEELQRVIDVITALRKLRVEHNTEPSKLVDAYLVVDDRDATLFTAQATHIERMAKTTPLRILRNHRGSTSETAQAFLPGIEVHLSLGSLIDPEKEAAALYKERDSLEPYVRALIAKLKNTQFIAHAPEAIVKAETEKLRIAEEKLAKLTARLQALSSESESSPSP